jgi:hypothetical protein
MNAAQSHRLWQRIAEIYARRLQENPAAAECLRALNLADHRVLEHFRAGYCDGTLPHLVSKSGEVQEALRAAGMLNESGEETLLGCLVVPLVAAGGKINGFCAIKPVPGAGPQETVVPGTAPGLARGGLARGESRLFVADRVLDTFALWLAGFVNVVAVPAPARNATELEELIQAHGFREVILCFDSEGSAPLSSRQPR